MPEYNISGTPVSFPFEPYQLQKEFMAKVIECLNNSTHGVLESPTGTGKTLSLLCSTLGWIEQRKAQVFTDTHSDLTDTQRRLDSPGDKLMNDENLPSVIPTVFYTSRTHSQLAKAVTELKRTKYNNMKAVVLGSREQLCIHPDVVKETNNTVKIQMCSTKISRGTCSFFQKLTSPKCKPIYKDAVVDIEDLITVGQKNQCCPYFMSKEKAKQADIIIMPYSYLLDPVIRKTNNLKFSDAVLILDEAHNVAKGFEDSVSVRVTSFEIAACINDIDYLLNSMPHVEKGSDDEIKFTIDDLALLNDNLLNLDKKIDEIEIISNVDGRTFQGSFMFELLEKGGLTSDNCDAKIKLISSIVSYVTNKSFFQRGAGLQKFLNMLSIVYTDHSEEYKQNVKRCFKVHVNFDVQQPKRASNVVDVFIQPTVALAMNKSPKVINFWCLSPTFGMQQLLDLNVRSIILTSGTLAPLKPLISEYGLTDAVLLENPHIVTSSQVCVRIVSKGPDDEPLISNYENCNNPKYLLSLGRTVLSLSHVVPDGLLVFFPSYDMMKKCKDSWQRNDILAQIQRVKAIHVEPSSKDKLEEEMKRYNATIKDPLSRGAIFLAVCRGKISEGLDFDDENGRAVIITGLPFPPAKDPRVILKKKYLDTNRTTRNEMLSGDEWYFLEATRAVNQAIGRIVRHKNDYGAIFLCDQRFNQPRLKLQLSSWVRGHLETQQCKTFGSVIAGTAKFFQSHVPEGFIRKQLFACLPHNNGNSSAQPLNRVKGVEPSDALSSFDDGALSLYDDGALSSFDDGALSSFVEGALSSFNDKKSKMLKEIKRKMLLKNGSLNMFMDSLDLEALRLDISTQSPQEVVDRCTAMQGKRNAIIGLQTSISTVCELSLKVQLMLEDIKDLLIERQREENHQDKSREYFERKFQQYQDANAIGLRKNNALKVVIEYHFQNLKILTKPLAVINAGIPICGVKCDEAHLSQISILLDKVNEMRTKREELFDNFQKTVNSNNVENVVVGRSDRNLKEDLEKEIYTCKQSFQLIKENLSTQTKILKDLSESYDHCKPYITAVVDTKRRQDRFFSSLVSSHDIYDDLLKKSSKSLESNIKLYEYTEKLLAAVKKKLIRTTIPVSTERSSTKITFAGQNLVVNECDGIQTLYNSFKRFLQENHIFSNIKSTTCQKDDVKVELLLCEVEINSKSFQCVYFNNILALDGKWAILMKKLVKERFGNNFYTMYVLYIKAGALHVDESKKQKIIENCIRRCVSAIDIVRNVE